MATASGAQSVASTRPPASAAAMRRQPEPAAELEHAPPAQRRRADRARERDPARPQLGPVRQELLVLERLLVEQRLAVARREQAQLAPAQCDDVLDEIVHVPTHTRRRGNGPRRLTSQTSVIRCGGELPPRRGKKRFTGS